MTDEVLNTGTIYFDNEYNVMEIILIIFYVIGVVTEMYGGCELFSGKLACTI